MSTSNRILLGVETCLYLLVLTLLLSASGQIVSTNPGDLVRGYTRPVEFDFIAWTMDAFAVKFGQAAVDTPFYFDESTRHRIVLDYLDLMDIILQDEYQLNLLYTNPSVKDPAASSADLRFKLSKLYARQDQLAPIAEAILQEQLSTVLNGLHLTTGGQPIPPVLFHISPLPDNLVVSPRDHIEQETVVSLIPNLPVDQQVALEERVDKGLNVSSLVVPVGGLGAYPTMIMRTTALDWLCDTIAHEWIHNWLTLRPLGLNYGTTPELRAMNETTASIAGGEIAQIFLRQYYPEKVAADTSRTIRLLRKVPTAAFDFNAEMHTTRVHVDELLASGKIDEAETYMEQRRQFFWDAGCPQCAIRKLNQAYFAFYGAYEDVPGGAAGEDPVGPAVRALRAQSASLTIFLEKISRMNSFAQLQAAVSP